MLYCDQIDMGTGRKTKRVVKRGEVESPARADLLAALYPGGGAAAYFARRGNGAAGEGHVSNELEDIGCTVLVDIIRAAGPKVIVVIEDFILGWGEVGKAKSSDRAGLSPVRIQSRLHGYLARDGFFNGDMWREWDGHGVGGVDERGFWVASGESVDYLTRLVDAQCVRVGLPRRVPSADRALWRGDGGRYVLAMPGSRFVIGGSEARTVEWLHEQDMWVKGKIHAMDSLMHLMATWNKMGISVRKRPIPIWAGGAKVRVKSPMAVRR